MSLSIHHLETGYKQQKILHNITTTIPTQKITALIGPNGCGKSTLLKSIARLLQAEKGEIQLNGKNIQNYSAKEYAKQLAYLPQQHLIPEGIIVKHLVGYGRSPYLNLWGKLSKNDKKIIGEAMHATKIHELSEKRVDELSGGQQQRAFIAMALAQKTPYLLLDEPTTYLDLNHQISLMEIMRKEQQRGATVITVLHDLNQAARYCDHLIVLKKGELIAEGAPKDVLTHEILHEVFNVEATAHHCPESKKPMCIINNAPFETASKQAP